VDLKLLQLCACVCGFFTKSWRWCYLSDFVCFLRFL
jgi:hypothetical protein